MTLGHIGRRGNWLERLHKENKENWKKSHINTQTQEIQKNVQWSTKERSPTSAVVTLFFPIICLSQLNWFYSIWWPICLAELFKARQPAEKSNNFTHMCIIIRLFYTQNMSALQYQQHQSDSTKVLTLCSKTRELPSWLI